MITIVKIGGAILNESEKRETFLDAFSKLDGPKFLVHGGGKSATELAALKGIPSEFVEGRRVTGAAMLEVAITAYSGINSVLVAGLQRRGINAIGITGADDSCMPARKRTSGNTDYGWVGDPLQDAVLSTWVKDMLHKNTVPVCAPLSWDRELGSLLNTNADAVALFWVHQLQQLDTVKLIYAFGHAGVLTDIGNPESCMPQIAFTDLETYKQDGTIHAGMIPKLECGFQALQHGALQVLVTAYDRLDGGTQLHLL